MDIRVTLSIEKRMYKGKSYAYRMLRWFGSDGVRHGQSLGRADKISKRQADLLRHEKERELVAQPGRRDMSRSPELGPFLDGYLADRKGELRAGPLELHQQTARYLVGHFGEKQRLDGITRADARTFKTAIRAGVNTPAAKLFSRYSSATNRPCCSSGRHRTARACWRRM